MNISHCLAAGWGQDVSSRGYVRRTWMLLELGDNTMSRRSMWGLSCTRKVSMRSTDCRLCRRPRTTENQRSDNIEDSNPKGRWVITRYGRSGRCLEVHGTGQPYWGRLISERKKKVMRMKRSQTIVELLWKRVWGSICLFAFGLSVGRASWRCGKFKRSQLRRIR